MSGDGETSFAHLPFLCSSLGSRSGLSSTSRSVTFARVSIVPVRSDKQLLLFALPFAPSISLAPRPARRAVCRSRNERSLRAPSRRRQRTPPRRCARRPSRSSSPTPARSRPELARDWPDMRNFGLCTTCSQAPRGPVGEPSPTTRIGVDRLLTHRLVYCIPFGIVAW